ncbi:hypothetical protein O181_074451 [Austropuccinia psidii MF-1]|uniref:Uncharacterized protein n=1 Tax=Austropuccinia psidii MF-1 TaxID=1389203 RepID=A0A9Q3F6L0_9BASI|nr:hypothetical protein [Austropuccinia psidii MF-1]
MVAILEEKTIKYFHTYDICQKEIRGTGKKIGLIIHIQEPKSPWEVFHEFKIKHPTFLVSLIKQYQPATKELFPLRKTAPFTVPPVEQNEYKNIKKISKKGDSGVKIKGDIFSFFETQYMKTIG